MDLSRNFFIGIKSEKSEAKAFEFSGPLIQMLIIRFFMQKLQFSNEIETAKF